MRRTTRKAWLAHLRISIRGFSLLELLIASVVVAAAGVLLFGSLAQITRSRQLAQEQRMMRMALASRLASLETVTDGEQAEGLCEAPYAAYRWALAATAGTLPSLAHVTLSIISPSGHTMNTQTLRPLSRDE